jgi:hypothetical protein
MLQRQCPVLNTIMLYFHAWCTTLYLHFDALCSTTFPIVSKESSSPLGVQAAQDQPSAPPGPHFAAHDNRDQTTPSLPPYRSMNAA